MFLIFCEFFSCRFVKLPFCISSKLPQWAIFFWKLILTIFFGSLVIKFWQAHEHFNFWCPMEDSGQYIFLRETCFSKILSGLSTSLTGVWPENLRQLCWSNILLGQRKILREMFFEKLSTVKTFAEFEISTCGHSAKIFWQGFQSCFLVFEKNYLRKNIHFGKKTLCMKVSGLWWNKSKFCRVFPAPFSK